MQTFKAPGRLLSGGLITNYKCPSKCAHCLYACGPERSWQYIDYETALACFRQASRLGAGSMHIGGGEPFLNFKGLARVIEAAGDAGVKVDYVETNSAWFTDHETACRILGNLRQKGLTTLLVSISPFHNQFIPFAKVLGVIRACEETDLRVFPWIADFIPEIRSLGVESTHGPEEYMRKFGEDYLAALPGRYWVHMGGRAALTYNSLWPPKPLESILEDTLPCPELFDVSHFHIDPYGNYLPGLCTGLALGMELLGSTLSQNDFPVLGVLAAKGIAGLFDLAQKEADFEPQGAYLNKCALCLDIRSHLVRRSYPARELQPKGFYRALES